MEEGTNPEVEVGRALIEKTSFTHLAPVAGTLTYRSGQKQPMTLAAVMGLVPNEGDAWSYTCDAVRHFFLHIVTQNWRSQQPPLPARPVVDLAGEDLPSIVPELIGPYLESARLMGRRTAELHVALASLPDDPAFAPEPFTILYQRSLYQTVRTWVYRMFELLKERVKNMPEEMQVDARALLAREADLVTLVRLIMERKITAQRIRGHGDYQLRSLLYTGKDFALIDFEGEILRPLSNRRHKRSPLRDVAGLLYSLYAAVRTTLKEAHLRPEDVPALTRWARFWNLWASVAFFKAYLESAEPAAFLPRSREEMQILLNFYFLGRGVSELRYQLLNRPDRVQIPLQALLHLLDPANRSSTPTTEAECTTPAQTSR